MKRDKLGKFLRCVTCTGVILGVGDVDEVMVLRVLNGDQPGDGMLRAEQQVAAFEMWQHGFTPSQIGKRLDQSYVSVLGWIDLFKNHPPEPVWRRAPLWLAFGGPF